MGSPQLTAAHLLLAGWAHFRRGDFVSALGQWQVCFQYTTADKEMSVRMPIRPAPSGFLENVELRMLYLRFLMDAAEKLQEVKQGAMGGTLSEDDACCAGGAAHSHVHPAFLRKCGTETDLLTSRSVFAECVRTARSTSARRSTATSGGI